MENEFTLSGAISIIFAQSNEDVATVTGWNYNTITSHKYRWLRNKLSYEKQEELILQFGFKRIAEFRYKFPYKSVKGTIDENLKKEEVREPMRK